MAMSWSRDEMPDHLKFCILKTSIPSTWLIHVDLVPPIAGRTCGAGVLSPLWPSSSEDLGLHKATHWEAVKTQVLHGAAVHIYRHTKLEGSLLQKKLEKLTDLWKGHFFLPSNHPF